MNLQELLIPGDEDELRRQSVLSALSWLRTAEAALDPAGPIDADKALAAILQALEDLYPLVGDAA